MKTLKIKAKDIEHVYTSHFFLYKSKIYYSLKSLCFLDNDFVECYYICDLEDFENLLNHIEIALGGLNSEYD